MPNSDAIVSTVASVERPAGDAAQTSATTVELSDGRRVLLDPADARSPGRADLLRSLGEQRLPVFLEVDPATTFITELLVPHVARVVAVTPIDEGVLGVVLDSSHARHVIRATNADSVELERVARSALERGAVTVVTENDRHEIIDLRDLMPGTDDLPPRFPLPGTRPRLSWWRRLIDPVIAFWYWPIWPWWWFCCSSMAKAQQVFDAMAATTCQPLTVPAPCIPFLYPDDGCWARAHEMCRLMIGRGLSPRKVWIQGSLYVSTRNNPSCHVWWGWHVAPTLCVRGPTLFQSQRMVIDPSLFTTPVTKAAWKGVQGDPTAMLTDTDASDYFWGSTDLAYVDTNKKLAFYRVQLHNRALQYGPPPYANCP